MATRPRRDSRGRDATYSVGDALIDAADAIADMAQRVQLNGPEPTYASEKLGTRCPRRPRGSRCATSSSRRSPRRRAAATRTDC